MFGLDERIAMLSDGASLWLVVLVAVLLGLRHATDPDHIAAVTALAAGARERAVRGAGRLGLAWGFGHATTLFAVGLPVVVYRQQLPAAAYRAAEAAIALVIVVLAVRLLGRWRRDRLCVHAGQRDARRRPELHTRGPERREGHDRLRSTRSPLGAFAIGQLHGVGGSVGASVLVLASVESTGLAVLALVLLALFTAISLVAVSTGFGLALLGRPLRGTAPALGLAALAFGIWYGLGALELAPYAF